MKKEASINIIIGLIFFTIILVSYTYHVYNSGGPAQAKATHDLIKIRKAINNFKLQTNVYPSQNHGISSLLEKTAESGYKGPFLNPDIITDPWGTQYIYDNQNNTVVYIGSAGPNQKWESSTEDVLSGNLKGDDRAEIIKAK